MASQRALWLNKPGKDLVPASNEIPKPGPRQRPRQKLCGFSQFYGLVFPQGWLLSDEELSHIHRRRRCWGREMVGEDVTNLAVGDIQVRGFPRVYTYFCGHPGNVLAMASTFFLTWPNITFEQTTSACVGILPFVVHLYSGTPWFWLTALFEDEGGVGKYAGQAILIMVGDCLIGQHAI
ncbi:hypothetical protein HD554DRAFT_2101830 [Boletus coccyginus]|nr:hypothetical protein HD554DRAFT_2101830 [Boletus coccyginus]